MRTLQMGSTGPSVVQLQTALSARLNRVVAADGQFGPRTAAAVSDFQFQAGLQRTGVADAATLTALGLMNRPVAPPPAHSFRPGAAVRLDAQDFVEVAAELQVNVNALRAFAEVEAAGSGFLRNGLPKILFERHVFWRELGKLGLTEQRTAFNLQRPDICGPKAYTNRADAETSDRYINGEGNYVRLEAAIQLSRQAALNSCSWGMFQIMGFNAVPIGYPSTDDFVAKIFESEKYHLESVARFIRNDRRLVNALRALDWTTVASIYNGPAFRQFKYDEKMATAFAKWSRGS